jgi:ABC-type nitrate/sulfonate/bicarbonate transport system permease component
MAPLAIPLVVLVSWQMLSTAGVLDPLFFPPPARLLPAAARLWASGELPMHLRATLLRLSLGLILGVLPGLALGLAMGRIALVRRALDPVISALYTTPKISVLPLLILVLGVGEAPRLGLIAAAAFTTMTIQTADAVRAIDPNYSEVARSCGAGTWLTWRRVYFPAVLPQLLTGFRLAFGRALLATITVELFNCQRGIGSMIVMAWQTFATDKLYLGVILTALLGIASHTALKLAERYAAPWRRA